MKRLFLLTVVVVWGLFAQIAAANYSTVEIVNQYSSEGSISFDVLNQNLQVGDFYHMHCVNQEEDRYVDERDSRRGQAGYYEDEELMNLVVSKLRPGTNYRCTAAIATPSEGGISFNYHNTQNVSTEESSFEDLYNDIGPNHRNADAIMFLSKMGVFNGYPDGDFKPGVEINRAELLKMLVEARGFTVPEYGMVISGYSDISEHGNCFHDVSTEWFAPYVCFAKSAGWINGYPDGTFKPAQLVNKVEALKMLMTTQSVEVPEAVAVTYFSDVSVNDWFAKYVSVAVELGLIEQTGDQYNPSSYMLRGSIAESLYRLL